MTSRDVPRIPLQLSRGCVVASIQVDLDPRVLAAFQRELLDLVQRSGARGVVLDVSGMEIIDLEEFAALRRTVDMAHLMGASAVFAGLHPGVISSLIDLDADVRGIHGAINLDTAFELLDRLDSDQDAPATESEDPELDAGDSADRD